MIFSHPQPHFHLKVKHHRGHEAASAGSDAGHLYDWHLGCCAWVSEIHPTKCTRYELNAAAIYFILGKHSCEMNQRSNNIINKDSPVVSGFTPHLHNWSCILSESVFQLLVYLLKSVSIT